MTPEAQNFAIAKACGLVSRDEYGLLYKTEAGYVRDRPDYLNDLNAMHAALYNLTPEQIRRYRLLLRESCGTYDEAIDATAAERAEALLKTLNPWTEK